MNDDLIYLDTYVLQQDMRIRMPKGKVDLQYTMTRLIVI